MMESYPDVSIQRKKINSLEICKYIDLENKRILLPGPYTKEASIEHCLSKQTFPCPYKPYPPKKEQKTLACIILIHSNFKHVYRMIKRLNHSEIYFFIHITAYNNHDKWELHAPNVFILPRVAVNYRGYSFLNASLQGYYYILHQVPIEFKYISVNSGGDYPLYSADYIVKYFQDSDREFIDYWPFDNASMPRMSLYYDIDNQLNDRTHKFVRELNHFFPHRNIPLKPIIGGAPWYILTSDCVRYCMKFISDHPEVMRFFFFACIPEEAMIHTIVYHSHFRDRANGTRSFSYFNGHFNHPMFINETLLDLAYKTEHLFARKFKWRINKNILDIIDKRIENSEQNLTSPQHSHMFQT